MLSVPAQPSDKETKTSQSAQVHINIQELDNIGCQAGLFESTLLRIIPESWAKPLMQNFCYQHQDLPGVTTIKEINDEAIQNIISLFKDIKVWSKEIVLPQLGKELRHAIKEFLKKDTAFNGDKAQNEKYIEELKNTVISVYQKLLVLEDKIADTVESYKDY